MPPRTMKYWWGEGQKPSPRFAHEILSMKAAFPLEGLKQYDLPIRVHWDYGFKVQTIERRLNRDNPNELYWNIAFRFHEIERRSQNGSQDMFRLKILYPASYPHDEPRVWLESHNVNNSPHLFGGGVLCLYQHGSNRSKGWDPGTSTAATFGVWSVQWVRAWLYWKRTNDWPNA